MSRLAELDYIMNRNISGYQRVEHILRKNTEVSQIERIDLEKTVFVLLGPPAFGKSEMIKMLQEELAKSAIGITPYHVSKFLESRGLESEKIFKRGGLISGISDSYLEYVLNKQNGCGGFVLDGFPRNNQQAAKLQEMCNSTGLSVVIIHPVLKNANPVVPSYTLMLKREGRKKIKVEIQRLETKLKSINQNWGVVKKEIQRLEAQLKNLEKDMADTITSHLLPRAAGKTARIVDELEAIEYLLRCSDTKLLTPNSYMRKDQTKESYKNFITELRLKIV